MARPRKSKTAQPAAQEILVPREEQPYAVPKNWQWVRLGRGITLQRGVSYQKSDAHLVQQPNDCLILRGGNIQEGKIIFSSDNIYINKSLVKNEQLLQKHDIIIVTSTGSKKVIGRSGISQDSYNNVAFGAFLTLARPGNLFIKQYICYFSQSIYFRNRIQNLARGTNINNVRSAHITECPFPLPPLAEQERIVARIERLFSSLNKAREKVEGVIKHAAVRKAAILHKAFTGELTAQWREAHGIGIDSWEEQPISSLCDSLQYGTAKKSCQEGKIAVIRMGNLQDGEINWDNLVYSNDEDDNKKFLLHPGDVLFNRTNSPELVGKTAIYRGEFPAIYAGYIIRLKYKKSIITGEYLNYTLNTIKAKQYCYAVKSDGVNQSNINAAKIGAFSIPVPPLSEQVEIVRILDELLEKERGVQEAAGRVVERIERIRQTILARAFRGELGTNDPTEPPSPLPE